MSKLFSSREQRTNLAARVLGERYSLVMLIILAFAVRLYALSAPLLRWDEGWSLAHASLPWRQLWQVAAEEWHPPLYVALLKLWLITGKTAWGIRYLSVLLGVLAVPLSYAVAKVWAGRARIAILAAGFAAFWPLLVYYGQVARMYALSALLVLAATWFALRLPRHPCSVWGLVVSSLLALYTLYYTALPLIGIWIYAAILSWPRRARALAAALAMTVAGYLPWILVARWTLEQRLSPDEAINGSTVLGTFSFLKPALVGLTFSYGRGRLAAMALGILFLAGLICKPLGKDERKRLALPLLALAISTAGVTLGAQLSYWFAPRHLVPASAFLGLALAWSLDRAASRWRPLLPASLLALGIIYWPISSRFVYQKTLEVVEPFDPAADYRYLSERARPGDLIYFNALSRAGWYESLRRADDPRWSYAMRWNPIVEPMDRITTRIMESAKTHHRLWFVFYQGTWGPNGDLKKWLDSNLYPAAGEWRGDTLYLAYGVPSSSSWASGGPYGRFANGACLKAARWTTDAPYDGVCALSLTWETDRPIHADYKVFVHAMDDAGRLVTQHDDFPGGGDCLTSRWQPGAEIEDRHGLLLPSSDLSLLHIRVGLYDPGSGERVRLANGADAIDLGICMIR